MRIAYFAHLNDGRGSGVIRKIAGQLGYWRGEGHTARMFVATTDDDEPWQHDLGDIVVSRYGGIGSRLASFTRIARAMRGFHPDLIYMRGEMFYPPMLWFPGDAPITIEVNTDDLKEGALGSRVRAVYNAWTRGFLLRRAKALVFVTSELSRLPSFRGFSAEHHVISNGIDLAAYQPAGVVRTGPRRLVFVGTGDAHWHGIDKLCRLAAVRSDWRFDVVGSRGARPASTPNVTWHGQLERSDFLPILAAADVGVGTLALHRKGMDEASPLKVREYLAVGLPVLYGYSDPDADGLGSYVLRIANTETNVMDDLPRIDRFVEASRGVRVPRAAVGHIDIREKEEQRLALFTRLANA